MSSSPRATARLKRSSPPIAPPPWQRRAAISRTRQFADHRGIGSHPSPAICPPRSRSPIRRSIWRFARAVRAASGGRARFLCTRWRVITAAISPAPKSIFSRGSSISITPASCAFPASASPAFVSMRSWECLDARPRRPRPRAHESGRWPSPTATTRTTSPLQDFHAAVLQILPPRVTMRRPKHWPRAHWNCRRKIASPTRERRSPNAFSVAPARILGKPPRAAP